MKLEELKGNILSGKVFIYPTDTVYGLGCDATNIESVKNIMEIKGREKDKPLSIIAPSIKWIEDNCVVNFDIKKYLPGPYTLILKKKDVKFLINVSKGDNIGVRIPKNSFCDKIRKIGAPFVTTSVNYSGMDPALSIDKINKNIINSVDIIIDDGKLDGKSSSLIINGKVIRR